MLLNELLARGDELRDSFHRWRLSVTPAVDLNVAAVVIFDHTLVVETVRVRQVDVQADFDLEINITKLKSEDLVKNNVLPNLV